jgi:hypothetical protein
VTEIIIWSQYNNYLLKYNIFKKIQKNKNNK